MAPIVEERVRFGPEDLQLAGVLAYPEHTPCQCAVLLCAPHPNFAGNMENNVVCALARHLAQSALVLRFDYRGVGESAIRLPENLCVFDYWNEIEETQHYDDPVEDVARAARTLAEMDPRLPLAVVGYSFGAIAGLKFGLAAPEVHALVGIAPPFIRCDFEFLAACAKRCLLLNGAEDFVYVPERGARLDSLCGPHCSQVLLPGQDHFYRGCEELVCRHVSGFLQSAAL